MNIVRVCHRFCVPLAKHSVSLNLFKQSAVCYSVKRQHRRPVKIYDQDGETEIDERGLPKTTGLKRTKLDEIQGVIELEKDSSRRNVEAANLDESTEDEIECDDEVDGSVAGTTYVRLGDRDRLFDRRMINVQSKKQREKSNMIMLEGKRLIQDAVTAGVIPNEIFFTRRSLIEDLVLPPGVIKLYKMPLNHMKKWSPLQTPPGLIAFCRMPKQTISRPKNPIPVTVICDNVREPGNMGTILRTVAGVGCLKVLLTKGCTDIWDSKVLRAAAGAHFHIPVESGLNWDGINKNFDHNTSIFIAHHCEEKTTAEGHTIPTIPYYSIDYSCLSDIAVIIGGETEGISDDAIQLARYMDGVKINIPMNCDIESLNVGAATSTILFEMKRQFIVNNREGSYINNNNNSNKNIILSQ